MNTNNEKILSKAHAFFKSQGMCHISVKGGGWYNGVVQEISSDFLMIHDREDGLLPIFFDEILEIERYIKRDGDGGWTESSS